MAKKPARVLRNDSGGIDLVVERDGGNEVRILTGNTEYSRKFWKQLHRLSSDVLSEMDTEKDA